MRKTAIMTTLGAISAAFLLPVTGASAAGPSIIGGDKATENYSFMTQLGGCGGTLIAKDWVVTAGHCADLGSSVRIGSNDAGSGGEVRSVDRTVTHPDFQGGANPNDIALKHLTQASSLAPAKLATAATESGAVRLLGFGATSGNGPQSPYLKQLDTEVLDDAQCSSGQTEDPFNPKGDLCIKQSPQASSCNGDSGGPALVGSEGNWTLIGVTSRGATGCSGRQPTIYTDAGYYHDWITKTIGE